MNEIVLPKSGAVLTRDADAPRPVFTLLLGGRFELQLYEMFNDGSQWRAGDFFVHLDGVKTGKTEQGTLEESIAFLDARVLELRAALAQKSPEPVPVPVKPAEEFALLIGIDFDYRDLNGAVAMIRARDLKVRAAALEEAAKLVATSTSRDCCHETVDRSVEAILALAGRNAP